MGTCGIPSPSLRISEGDAEDKRAEHGIKPEWLGTKLYKDNGLSYYLFASNDVIK